MKNKNFGFELIASLITIAYSATVFSVLVKSFLEILFPEIAIPFFVLIILYLGIQTALISTPGFFISSILLYYLGVIINPDDEEAQNSQNSSQRLAQIGIQLIYTTVYLVIGAIILLFL